VASKKSKKAVGKLVRANLQRSVTVANEENLILVGGVDGLIKILVALISDPSDLPQTSFNLLDERSKLGAVLAAYRKKDEILALRGLGPMELQPKTKLKALTHVNVGQIGLVVEDLRRAMDAFHLHGHVTINDDYFWLAMEGERAFPNLAAKQYKASRERTEVLNELLQGLIPSSLTMLCREILVVSSKSKPKQGRFHRQEFLDKQEIILVILEALSRNPGFRKKLFVDFMQNKPDWKEFQRDFPDSLITILPTPNTPEYRRFLENGTERFSSKFSRLVTKKQKSNTAKTLSDFQPFSSNSNGEGGRRLTIPGIEKSTVNRSVIVTSLADSAHDLEPNENIESQDDFVAEIPQPAEGYQNVLESSVNPGKANGWQDFVNNHSGNTTLKGNDAGAKRKQHLVDSRQGQQYFRESVLRVYRWRCCITGNNVSEVLEAAHIQDWSVSRNNDVSNGLCLRVDIHTLFDRGLLNITDEYMINISETLRETEYWGLHGLMIRLPKQQIDWPKKQFLLWRLNEKFQTSVN
jgi:hypothetical protein